MAATDNVSGHEGTFAIGGSIYITSWSFTEETETKDVTDSSSGTDSDFIPEGHLTRSGTFEGFVKDGTDTPTIGGAAAEMTLTAETGLTWVGNAILTSKTITLTVKGGEAVKMTGTFQGTGSWDETNA